MLSVSGLGRAPCARRVRLGRTPRASSRGHALRCRAERSAPDGASAHAQTTGEQPAVRCSTGQGSGIEHVSGRTVDTTTLQQLAPLLQGLGNVTAVEVTTGFNDGGLDDRGVALPTQADAIVKGVGGTSVIDAPNPSGGADLMQELLAIQQNGPKAIGFFGTRNMGFLHQQLIEILSYAMVLTQNHIYTSGATGTNAAVIRGALRAERPELLTVVLPQSMSKQPQESQDLLAQVANVIQMPQNDSMALIDASRLCNEKIVSEVQQVICFAFHDSRLLLETCRGAKELRKIVTLFYLD